LTVAISTNGKSPGLAALMRRVLEHRIGPKWEIRLDEIAALRQGWREAGADPAAIGRWTQEWADRRGWLDPTPADPSHQVSRPIP
jgi:siroheme synthase (precorrin-2 oxidase/ferrochelatase)